MWTYENSGEHIIVERHFILIFIKFLKSFIYSFFALIVYFIFLKFNNLIDWHEWLNIILFVFMFVLINYSFFKFITYLIIYINNVIVLHKDQFFIIKSSLILKDDIENIDIYKIIKVDSFSHWFFSNVLWYWDFVIEQQKSEVRTFHYIANPHRLMKLFEEQRENYKTKKYVQV